MNFPSQFDLFDYFQGNSRAWGIFETPLGRCRRQLVVDLQGHVEGDTLILDEQFAYDDGEQQQRCWRIQHLGHNRYRGTAADTTRPAQGIVEKNRLHWSYQMLLPVGQRRIRIDFDDQIFLLPDGVAVNRARLSKWGLPVGSVTLVFQRR